MSPEPPSDTVERRRTRLGGRPFRPPTGLPAGREDRRAGALVSMLLHGAIIALLLGPAAFASKEAIVRLALGAGGEGPAGGGGGGLRGTGGWTEHVTERLTYLVPQPPKAAVPVAEAPKPVVVPPPAVVPPPPTVTQQPVIPPVVTPSVADQKPAATVASSSGTGGGTGADGSGGNGPGSGGGVGSGIGTGRGSGIGPGTGGGTQANYAPTPTELFLPPFPIPNRVKGFHLIAEFDVDEAGRVVDMRFTETRDGDYNRKLRDILRSIRFRPGTRPDGTPVRMKTQIEYSF